MSFPTLNNETKESVSVRRLMEAQFDEAKRWWTIAILWRLFVVIIAIISVLWTESREWLGILIAILTVVYILLQWHADTLQGKAELTLRKFEFQDGFGWEISKREITDLILDMSSTVKKQAYIPDGSPYFDSPKTISSPQRAIENLEQSSWFTKHQAKRMARFVLHLSSLIFGIAILTLVVLPLPPFQQWGLHIARIVITFLVFMFAGGYFHLGYRYHSLSQQAGQICNRASYIKELETISEIQAIKLLHEYQIVRVKAPMIPDWIWKNKKAELNKLWEQQSR